MPINLLRTVFSKLKRLLESWLSFVLPKRSSGVKRSVISFSTITVGRGAFGGLKISVDAAAHVFCKHMVSKVALSGNQRVFAVMG